MTTGMGASGRRGVSAATLVVVIMLALFAGVVCFAMYAEKLKAEEKYDRIKVEHEAVIADYNAELTRYNELKKLLTKSTSDKTIEVFYQELALEKRGIVVDPVNFRTLVARLVLANRLMSQVVLHLERNVDGMTAEAVAAEGVRDFVQDDYRASVRRKNGELSNLDSNLSDVKGKKDAELQKEKDATKVAQDAFDQARNQYEESLGNLIDDVEKFTRRNAVVQRELAVLPPQPTIQAPAGRIVRVEWRTERAVIDLGTGQVFPGLLFDVYFIDRNGQRIVKGKVEVQKAMEGSSVAIITSKDPELPIVAGDYLATPFAPFGREKRFVVAGIVPADAIYTLDQLKAIIKLNGGEVEDNVTPHTDVLVLGDVTLVEAGEISKEAMETAQTDASRGREEGEKARRYGHRILGWHEFEASIRR